MGRRRNREPRFATPARNTMSVQPTPKILAWAILLSLSVLGAAGCGSGGGSSTTSAISATSGVTSTTSTTSTASSTPASATTLTTSSTSAAAAASVEFLSPKDGTTTGPTIHAKVKVSGFQGGLRFTMRGEPSRDTASSTPEVTYSNLPSGQHTLHVELVGNGNAGSGVGASTTFIVKIVP